MTPLDLLQGVRALLADERCWTKGAYARTASGAKCAEINPEATCWCLMGAAYRVLHDRGVGSPGAYTVVGEAGDYLAWPNTRYGCRLTWEQFNDAHTHADVLALLDTGIQRATQQAPTHGASGARMSQTGAM